MGGNRENQLTIRSIDYKPISRLTFIVVLQERWRRNMNAKIRVPLYLISLIMLLAIGVTACQQTAQVEPTAAAVEPTAAAVEPTAAQVEPTATPAEPTAPAVEATEAEPAEAESEPITLSVWWISSSPEYADQISAIMKQYETQNPNITIEVTYFPYSDYVTAMGPALEAGDPPDLAFSDTFLSSVEIFLG
jgi:ABC-type glycerol-3-phosphate transport system substrate-binding protein